jgi:hypothetical protein
VSSSEEKEEERREIINIYILFPRCAGEIGRGISARALKSPLCPRFCNLAPQA